MKTNIVQVVLNINLIDTRYPIYAIIAMPSQESNSKKAQSSRSRQINGTKRSQKTTLLQKGLKMVTVTVCL